MRTAEVAAWVNEREAIRVRKDNLEHDPCTTHPALTEQQRAAWGAKPANYWQLDHLTDDPILSKFRFTCVRRQDDRVSKWIIKNIIEPYAEHEHLWLVLCLARTINWPPTLYQLMCEYPGAWPCDPLFKPKHLSNALEDWKRLGNKVYTGCYMIRAESDPAKPWYSWSKQRYIGEIVIGKLWEWRESFQAILSDCPTVAGVCEYLQNFTGWGPFMSFQACTDMTYCALLGSAPDKQTWAAAGPGTLRGLNRWLGNRPDVPMTQDYALMRLLELREELNAPGVIWPWLQPLDLSNCANVMCETDKYQRVRLGEGRPRALYVPGRGS